MVPAAADAINTWLDAAPQPEHAKIIPAARSLTAAIPAAVRLSPAGEWRSKWAEALARAAVLLPPAEVSPFASAAEKALFGQPCGRDWNEQELKSRKLLENLTKPTGPQ